MVNYDLFFEGLFHGVVIGGIAFIVGYGISALFKIMKH